MDSSTSSRARRRRSCGTWTLATVVSLTALWIPAARAEGPTVDFNLPAEPFTQAVLDFSHQSGLSAIYGLTAQMEKLVTRPVQGEMSSSAALTRMLQGSGLTFEFDSAHSVIIEPAEAAPTAVPAAQAGRVGPVALASAALEEGLLRQVDVTGSLIRGVQDVIAPLVYVQRQQLSQAAYATVEDALYGLPITSLNGPREDLGLDNNYQYGAGVNLRGLGVGATLVLIDGYRQPLAGLTGDFVDVSTIPWSAVKRIEVLPEGASALYGSDAIAGVVNIIMRDDFQGAETQARYGAAGDGRDELLVSQLLGAHWAGGHLMLAYEFSDATPLAAAARRYAANADKTPYGGGNYDSYYSNPGNILNPATLQPAYGIPAGQDGKSLTAAQLTAQINLANPFADTQIFPERTAHELYAAGSQDIGSRLELFAQGRFAQRDTLDANLPYYQILVVPPTNPFYVNPFAGAPYTLESYSFAADLGPTVFASRSRVYMGTVGARVRLSPRWQVRLSESYGRQTLHDEQYDQADPAALAAALADSNPATAFDPFGQGSYTNPATLAAIRAIYPLDSASGIESTSLLADGPLFALPAGEAKLAVGMERRQETLDLDEGQPAAAGGPSITHGYGRHVSSLFSQLVLPLAGSAHGRHGTPDLQLSLSGRLEHYSDFGAAFNPMADIHWLPLQSVKLRASWGRSFRAPTLDDLYDTSNNAAGSVVLPDPRSPSGRSLVLIEEGSNPGLKQETARTWTTGFDLAPPYVAGATLSLTYYSINYDNRIGQPAAGDPNAILALGNEWSAVITRNPTQAQIAAVCNSAVYQGSAQSCLVSAPAAIVDARLANLVATRTSGLDLEARQQLHNRAGNFALGVTGNYVFHFEQAAAAAAPPSDILNTVGNPLALRLRGTLGWTRRGPRQRGPRLELTVNHTGAYRNPASTLLPRVSAWTTVDFQAAYGMGPGTGPLSATEVTLNVVNVLNHDPPFVDTEFGYDVYNVQALGRVVSLDISKSW
ncbi:MAG TPA: TonB-dependent receptor [Steroidobacteraceae bacterium]|nr:TonB-dependent receptor [Steroidobacteraceae bacterium]